MRKTSRNKKRRVSRRQRKQRSQRKSINFGAVITFILLLGVVSYSVYFLTMYYGITTKDPTLENMSKNRILWQGKDGLESTIFVFEEEKGSNRKISDVFVVFKNNKKNSMLTIYLSGTLYFDDLQKDFGSPVSISSLRYAGEYFEENRGVEYALWQISEILGFKVNNYVWITTEASDILSEIYSPSTLISERDKEEYILNSTPKPSESAFKMHLLSKNLSNFKTYIHIKRLMDVDEQIFSNLSFSQLFKEIVQFKRVVEKTDAYMIDVSGVSALKEETTSQGGFIATIDIPKYDNLFEQTFSNLIDVKLEQERARVEVYNASGIPDIANLYSRKMLNKGCDVVRYATAPSQIERTQLYVSDKEDFKNTFSVISTILLDKYELIEERPDFMTTGDIVVIIGEDISALDMF